EFQVIEVNHELADTNVDLAGLRRIANLTGGDVVPVEELATLDSRITAEPVTRIVRTERPLWDNAWVALLLIGLAGVEWVQRRRHDLS
ncbi:MAG: hypothetical protein R3336_02385, partial [Phycisphaeraceae bacterium]|nr:hypothetical protein [Phycisphaeraceae bacterium]